MVKVKKEEPSGNHADENGNQETACSQEDEERKPGQKFPTPSPGYGDRVFYETLLRHRPDSIMAQEW